VVDRVVDVAGGRSLVVGGRFAPTPFD